MRSDPVELAMALEEALLSDDKRLAELKPFLVDPPQAVSCVKGGFETEALILAKHRSTAFFISDIGQFGVGETNEFGDIVESTHYPTITMALRAFVGAASRHS